MKRLITLQPRILVGLPTTQDNMVKGIPIEMGGIRDEGEVVSTGTPIKQRQPRRKAKVIQMKIGPV